MFSKVKLSSVISSRVFLMSLSFLPLTSAMASDLFSDDFERPLSSSPQPVLAWSPAFDPITQKFGMMYGKGDIYERSSTVTHSGNYSLRLNFDGRNGWANTDICGFTSYTATVSGNTLQVNGAALTGGVTIFDRTDRFARYDLPASLAGWTSVNGGVVPNGAATRNEMGGAGVIKNGDEILVSACPFVSGDRLNDTNVAINYLNNISQVTWPYGGTIARRMYVYIPSSTIMPEVALKLGYFDVAGASGNLNNWTVLDTNRKFQLTGAYTSIPGGDYVWTNYLLGRDKWYYIEEVYTRETSPGAANGTYQIYAGPDGADVSKPLFQFSGLTYGGNVSAISIIGNWQHWQAATGYVYLDDVKVATQKIGPASFNGAITQVAAPASPSGIAVTILK